MLGRFFAAWKRSATPDVAKRRPLGLTELEDRVLFSASPLPVEAVLTPDTDLMVATDVAADAGTSDTAGTGNANDGGAATSVPLGNENSPLSVRSSFLTPPAFETAPASETDRASEPVRQLLFVDTSVDDFALLVQDIYDQHGDDAGIEVVLLDSGRDGIEQITDELTNYRDLDAVHFVTHGTDGAVKLGNTWLRLATLDTYAGAISTWNDAIGDGGDILFFGCDLASNDAGKTLIDAVSELTGADVAASTDDTGHALFGGDWELEYSTGAIEASVLFSDAVRESWGHLMNVTVDATSTGTAGAGVTSDTNAHTTSGDDRLMLVGISFGNTGGDSVSSVTYNGVNLTPVGSDANGSSARVEIWSLVAPDTGTHDVVVNFSGTNHGGATIGIMTFNGVDQATALGSFSSATGNSADPTTTVSSAAGEVVFGVAAFDQNTDVEFTPGSGQTEQWDLFRNTANGSGTTAAGAATVPTSWAVSQADRWAAAGVSIKTGTLVVDTTDDTLDGDTASISSLLANKGGDGFISLREAIIATNNTAGANKIVLSAGTYTLSNAGSGEDAATTGDLDILDDLTIVGDGAGTTILDGGSSDRIFHALGTSTVAITGVTLQNGLADFGGGLLVGATSSVTVNQAVLSGHLAAVDGGAINNAGTLVLNDVRITGSQASQGGGLLNNGDTTLNRVTVDANMATSGGGISSVAGSLSLTNATLSGNSATAGGGAIHANHAVTILNSTIYNNSGATGGLQLQGAGSATLTNTILAGNTGGNTNFAVTSLGGNIDSGSTAGLSHTTDQSNTDPLLSTTLDDNGGFTPTHAITPASPAWNAGVIAGSPTVDQRGFSRDAYRDAGAFEVPPVDLLPTNELAVNTTVSGAQQTTAETRGSQRAVAIAPTGEYVVVWSTDQATGGDGSGRAVFMRRFDANGTPLSAETLVNQQTTGDQQFATVDVDDAGNGVVVWTSDGQDGSGQGVYARRFDRTGAFVGNEFLINTTTAGDQKDAAVAMNGFGEFVVVWKGNGAGDADGIFYRRFDGAGNAMDAVEQPANASDRGVEDAPTVAINDSGQFGIAWHVGNDNYVRHFDAAGTPAFTDKSIETSLSNAYDSAMAIDDAGRTVVVYRTDGFLGTGRGVWGRGFNPDGSLWKDWFQVAGTDATSPSISMDGDGNFTVVYQHSTDGDGFAVMARQYDASGTSQGSAFQVNQTTTGDQALTSVAMLDLQNYVVTWSGRGPGDADGVFVRQFGPTVSTVTVTTTSDLADGDTSSITALLGNQGADGKISLREAITAANNTANAGSPDQIRFGITGSGPHVINLTAALPDVTDAVTIDGYSQTGAAANTLSDGSDAVFLIEINGGSAGNVNGLVLEGSGTTVRGLVIGGFSQDGIVLRGGGGHVVEGNFVGTDITGTSAQTNDFGIAIESPGNKIGGTSPADRNLISGNLSGGIIASSAGATGNTIQGNYIGTQADGMTGLGNSGTGIHVATDGNAIGGTDPGAANTIAFNGGTGVTIAAGQQNPIRHNLIHGNGGLSIDLNGDTAINANDLLDGDTGANALQNFPVISTATLNGGDLTVVGTLNSTPGTTLDLDFFASSTSGQGNASRYLGAVTVVTDGGGDASFNQLIAAASVSLGEFITATATDASGNTSEFAVNVVVAAPNAPPSADAGTGYTMDEGGAVNLSGGASSDPDSDPLTYAWDLNNDGTFGDVTGATPTVDWATLQSFGIVDDGTYTVGLRVDDGRGGTGTATTSLTVQNVAPTLIVSGATTVTAGTTFTLNLSAVDPGDDTVTGWTINWGDGTIEQLSGNPSSATHTFTRGGFTFGVLASATDEDGTWLQNELITPSFSGNSVFRFDPNSGTALQEFANTQTLSAPVAAILGPDGKLYVGGDVSRDVLRYDANTGAFIDTFIPGGTGGLQSAEGLAFGPDGHLYVVDYTGDKILRFDAATGAHIDDFVTAGSGGLTDPYGLVFGPDGNLYVGGYTDHNVLRYDGLTGAFIDVFVAAGSGGLTTPEEIVFGPDGNLYVSSFGSDEVLRFDGTTGTFIDTFVSTGSGGLNNPTGLAFGPDGHLYVGDYNREAILRFNGTTGAFIDEVVAAGAGGLVDPVFLSFVPEHQIAVVASPVERYSDVATDLAGNYVVVWQSDSADGDGEGVMAQRYDSTGTAVGSQFQVNATTAGDQTEPRVAMDDLGNFVVTWTSTGQDGDGANETNVYARRFDAAGNPASGELLVNTTTLDNQVTPAVAMDALTGQFLISWASFSPSSGDWDIFARRFAADGTPVAGEFQVNTTTAGDQLDPDVSVDLAAEFVVVWTGFGQDGDAANEANIYGQYYRGNGNPLGGEILINTTTAGHQHSAAVASEDDGDYTIVWVSEGQDGDGAGIFGDQIAYGGSGNNRMGEFLVTNTTAGEQTHVDIASEPVGDFIAVWQSTGQDGDGATETNVYRRAFTVTNASISPKAAESLVSVHTGGNQQRPAVAADGEGDVVVAWDGAGASDPDGVFTRLYQDVLQNNAPTVSLANPNLSYTENDPPVIIDGGLTVSDPDDVNLAGATVSFHDGFAASEDVLSFTAVAGIAGSFDAGTGVLSFTGSATLASYQSVLRSVAFANTSEHPATAQRVLKFTVDDGASSSSDFRNINVATGNDDAPAIASGQSFNVLETAVNGTAVGVVSAADPEGSTLTNWQITGGNTAGLFAINAATGELTVADRSTLDFATTPAYALTVTVSDGVNTSASETVAISVIDVNNPPTAVDDTYAVDEGGTLTENVAPDWFNPNWSWRQQLTFNNSAQTSDLIDFPVLIKLHASAGDAVNINYGQTQDAGEDLRFIDAGGGVLAHEIEQWDESGYSYVWVSVPQVDGASTSDLIHMYYGNASAADGQSINAVWNAGERAVIHVDGVAVDSTAFDNDGIVTSAFDTNGVVAGAALFDGVSGDVNLGSAASLDDIFSGGGTISAWINPSSWGENGFGRIADKASTTMGANGDGFAWQVAGIGSSGYLLFEQGFTSQMGEWRTSLGSLSLNTWQHVVITYDSSSSTNTPRIFIDGIEHSVSQQNTPSGTARSDSALDLKIGNRSVGSDRTFDGRIDEFRVLANELTADEIAADHATVAGTFVSAAAVEAGPGGLLDNDADVDSDGLTASLVSGPSLAAAFTLNADGSFTYTHDGSETTSDSFVYRISDPGGQVSTATVNLTVNPINDAPTDLSLSNSVLTEGTDTTGGFRVGSLSAVDPDIAETFTWAVTGGADVTKFSIGGLTGEDLVLTDGTVDFERQASYQIIVQAMDSGGATFSKSLTLSVADVNDEPPVVASGQSFSVSETAGNGTVLGTVIATDADVGTTFSNWQITGGNPGGIFAIDMTSGEVTVADNATLDFESTSSYSLTVTVSDGVNVSAAGTVAVIVSNVNEAPSAVDDNYTVDEAATLTRSAATGVLINDTDPDGDTLVATLISGPNQASLFTLNADGSFTYAHDGSETTADAFTYRTTDPSGATSTATVLLTITPQNDPPVVSPAAFPVAENSPAGTLVGSMTATDSDPGDTVTWSIDAGNTNGAFAIDTATGVITVANPTELDFETTPSFNLTVRATDTGGASGTATAAVSLLGVNDAPVNDVPAAQTTAEDTPLVFSSAGGNAITVSDDDAGGQPVIVTLVATQGKLTLGSTAGLFFGTGDGIDDATMTFVGTVAEINAALDGMTFSPTANFHGTATMQISVDDQGNVGAGGAKADVDMVHINVTPGNDAPLASNDSFEVRELHALHVPADGVLGNDVDLDGDGLSAVLVNNVSHGTLTLHSDGSFTYTPATDFVGTDTFSYRASDGALSSSTVTVTITILPAPQLLPALVPTPTIESTESVAETEPEAEPDAEVVEEPADTNDKTDVSAGETVPARNRSTRSGSQDGDSSEETEELGSILFVVGPQDETSLSDAGNRTKELPQFATDPSRIRLAASSGPGGDVDAVRRALAAGGHDSMFAAAFQFTSVETQQDLNEVRDSLRGELVLEEIVAGTALMATTGLSVGYVIWVVRGGYLLASLLSTMPAWKLVDPLPILEYLDVEDDEDDESLEDIASQDV